MGTVITDYQFVELLGLPPSSSNDQSANQKILVIDQPKLFSGLQVDEILGIQTFSQQQYQPIEMLNDSPLAQYTHGRFKQNEQIWYVFMPKLIGARHALFRSRRYNPNFLTIKIIEGLPYHGY